MKLTSLKRAIAALKWKPDAGQIMVAIPMKESVFNGLIEQWQPLEVEAWKLVPREDGSYDLKIRQVHKRLNLENQAVRSLLFSSYDLLNVVEESIAYGLAVPEPIQTTAFSFRRTIGEMNEALEKAMREEQKKD